MSETINSECFFCKGVCSHPEACGFQAESEPAPASAPSAGDYWRSIETAPEDEHVILATSGGHVGEALMLIDEDTREPKWTWASGPVAPNHKPLGWRPMPSPIFTEVPRDDRPGGFDGPTGAD